MFHFNLAYVYEEDKNPTQCPKKNFPLCFALPYKVGNLFGTLCID